jgi:HTH-type transcriptional regulator/antitoxin HigA
MDIAPIKSHRDYRRVLKEIEGLMDARRNSLEGDRLDALVTMVEAWEDAEPLKPQRSPVSGLDRL